MNREELREAFPWLESDEPVSGANVIGTLSELYENALDPNTDEQQRFWLQHIASYVVHTDNDAELEILAGELEKVLELARNILWARSCGFDSLALTKAIETVNDAIIDSLHPDVRF
jgi:metal-responsive CopG/Arc/MetJ family transcriptional regulator